MNTFNLRDIADSVYFTDNVYLDKKFLLLAPATQLGSTTKKRLAEWDFLTLFSNGSFTFTEPMFKEEDPSTDVSDASLTPPPKLLAEAQAQDARRSKVRAEYLAFQQFTDSVYEEYRSKKTLNERAISQRVKELCAFVKENKQIILRIQALLDYPHDKFIQLHSLRSTVFAIIIGLQIKLQPHILIELATTALLHEIGMFALPPALYSTANKLNPQELKVILSHPIISYKVLKENRFSLSICAGVLEHHERENGTGYPRKLIGENITLYGKIIAVACSYEAATAPRRYKRSHDLSTGLVEMIRNSTKQYDDEILKALLYALSFYPIGVYVQLSDNRIAQVIDVNPDDPRFPLVQIYAETDENGKPIIIATDAQSLHIVKSLSREDVDEMFEKKSQ